MQRAKPDDDEQVVWEEFKTDLGTRNTKNAGPVLLAAPRFLVVWAFGK